jgi:hypothetical protein
VLTVLLSVEDERVKAGAPTFVVIDADADDALDVLIEFVALTVKVYEVEGVNPVTFIVPLPD